MAKFPGPPLFAISALPYLWLDNVKGSWAKDVLQYHLKYGPIVRNGPNSLALDGSVGWPQVYTHRPGRAEYPKDSQWFYKGSGIGLIAAPKDNHRRMRRQLAHAFSESALQRQEDTIRQYLDLLIQRLDEQRRQGHTVNIVSWFNFMTFDIIGDLMFSDSFHSLDTSDYHPWVKSIVEGIRGIALERFLRHLGLGALVRRVRLSASVNKDAENRQLGIQKAKSRLASKPIRNDKGMDFFDYMLRPNSSGQQAMAVPEMLMTSTTLVIAGSETTATALAGLVFLLSRNRTAYRLLAEEIRTRFSSAEDIDFVSSAHLPYLHACLEETLRVYPPAAQTPPRKSPGDFINDRWVPEGVGDANLISSCSLFPLLSTCFLFSLLYFSITTLAPPPFPYKRHLLTMP